MAHLCPWQPDRDRPHELCQSGTLNSGIGGSVHKSTDFSAATETFNSQLLSAYGRVVYKQIVSGIHVHYTAWYSVPIMFVTGRCVVIRFYFFGF